MSYFVSTAGYASAYLVNFDPLGGVAGEIDAIFADLGLPLPPPRTAADVLASAIGSLGWRYVHRRNARLYAVEAPRSRRQVSETTAEYAVIAHILTPPAKGREARAYLPVLRASLQEHATGAATKIIAAYEEQLTRYTPGAIREHLGAIFTARLGAVETAHGWIVGVEHLPTLERLAQKLRGAPIILSPAPGLRAEVDRAAVRWASLATPEAVAEALTLALTGEIAKLLAEGEQFIAQRQAELAAGDVGNARPETTRLAEIETLRRKARDLGRKVGANVAPLVEALEIADQRLSALKVKRDALAEGRVLGERFLELDDTISGAKFAPEETYEAPSWFGALVDDNAA